MFLDRLIRAFVVDIGVSLVAVALLLVVDRLFFPGAISPSLVAAVILVSIGVTLARTVVLTPLDLFSIAVLADDRLGLKERVATSLYLLGEGLVEGGSSPDGGRPGELGDWRRLVATDAWEALRGASLDRGFPVRLPRSGAWILVPACVCAGLAFSLPSMDFLGFAARRGARAEMQKAVEEQKKKLDDALASVEKEALEKRAAEARKLLELVRQNAREPDNQSPEKQGTGSGEPKKDALVEMARREEILKNGLDGKAFELLKDAMRSFRGLDLKSVEITRKLSEGVKVGDFRKAKESLDQLSEEVSKFVTKSPESLTPEEKARLEKLSEELSQLSKLTQGKPGALGKFSDALTHAAAGLNSADLPESLRRMGQAGEGLEELMKLADDMQLLNKALELVELTREELAALEQCPECGTPHCPDCGRPRCSCKPGTKPGGT